MNELLAIPIPASTREKQPAIALPRLGFLGLGWIGRQRLKAIVSTGIAEVCVLADPARECLNLATEIAPPAARVADLDELLEFDLDGVIVATPNAWHAAQSAAALRRGCAVFCQKPLARTAQEVRELIDEAREANRLLGVDLSYRHTTGMRAIRQLISDGELGDIYAVEMIFHNAYGPDKAWFYDKDLSGGGCLIDLGTHLVDLALWCLDFPEVEQVDGSLRAIRSEQVEDYAAAQIRLRNGATVQLACSWNAAAGGDARIEATFFGTRGGASFRNVNGSFYDFTAEHLLADRTRKVLAMPPDDWGGRGFLTWAQQLAKSREFNPEIETSIRVAATIDALYQNCT